MNEVVSKVMPILLLIVFGYYIQLKRLLRQSTVDEVKKAVINVALPAVLFLTFKNMVLKKEDLLIALIIFVSLILFYYIGVLLNSIKPFTHPLLPFLATSFAFGLLGVPLFGSIFGQENLGKILILGIGHEFFVWFVYLTLIKSKLGYEKFNLQTIIDFIKSPLILAIVLGVTINLLDVSWWFEKNVFLQGIERTLEYLGTLTTPIILIIIGYGLKINKQYLFQSVKLLVMRLVIIFTIGYSIKFLIIDQMMVGDPMFDYAYFTFLILPPPFSLSIFVGEYSTEENMNLANNTIVLSTLFCILAYVVFVLLVYL